MMKVKLIYKFMSAFQASDYLASINTQGFTLGWIMPAFQAWNANIKSDFDGKQQKHIIKLLT